MEEQNIDLIENNLSVRNSLVSIFEQLLFLVNTLNQNDKKHSNSNTLEVNEKLKISLNKLIVKLWDISNSYNYYWHNCSTEVYKSFYHDNKENLIKTYGKRRFYKFLEYELNSFLKIEKTNTPKEKLFVPNVFFQDAFILLDYSKYLNETNLSIVEFFNLEKIKFLKAEVEKDNYDISSTESYFEIKKIVSRSSKNSMVEIQNAVDTGINVENVNIINIGDKALPLSALNQILNNVNNMEAKNNVYDEVTDKLLSKKGLPDFNVIERFELFKLLGGKELFDNKIEMKKHKNLLLGISMDLNPDTAKKLQDGTYSKERDRKILRENIDKAKNKVLDYLEEKHIKIQN